MNTKNIGIIGIGRLGLSFALLAEHCGYNVIGYDINNNYLQSLRDKTFRTTEPLVEQYLRDSKNLNVTNKIEDVINHSDVLFLFVPTPSLEDGSYNHSAIDDVVSQLQQLSKVIDLSDKILVIGCTVMPKYTNIVSNRLKECGISIVYNPEFIAQGDIINGLKTADMVLVGTESESSVHALSAIYQDIMTKPLNMRVMSPTAAELTKICINCFLTTKIAYANMVGEIAINSGVESEISTILQAIGSDSRIGHKYLNYGFGYGGVCLPRDNKALIAHSRNIGCNPRIAEGTEAANYLHHSFLRDYITGRAKTGEPFIFSQLSYKKGVDILTESQQYKLCKELLGRGYNVVIHESEAVCNIVRKEMELYIDQITFNQDVPGYKIEL